MNSHEIAKSIVQYWNETCQNICFTSEVEVYVETMTVTVINFYEMASLLTNDSPFKAYLTTSNNSLHKLISASWSTNGL